MTTDYTNITDTQTNITTAITGGYRISGSTLILTIDPTRRLVSTYAGVGGGVPAPVWNGEWMSFRLNNRAVPTSIAEVVVDHLDIVVDLIEGHGQVDEFGMPLSIDQHDLFQCILDDGVQAFGDASEWVMYDPTFIHDDCYDDMTFDEVVSDLLSEAEMNDLILDPDDLRSAMEELLQSQLEDATDLEDADRVATCQRLLATI